MLIIPSKFSHHGSLVSYSFPYLGISLPSPSMKIKHTSRNFSSSRNPFMFLSCYLRSVKFFLLCHISFLLDLLVSVYRSTSSPNCKPLEIGTNSHSSFLPLWHVIYIIFFPCLLTRLIKCSIKFGGYLSWNGIRASEQSSYFLGITEVLVREFMISLRTQKIIKVVFMFLYLEILPDQILKGFIVPQKNEN